jgi:hypothetical protein
MVVHYKKNGRDTKVYGVSWVDIFIQASSSTAVFMKDGQETEIPLRDLISITDK